MPVRLTAVLGLAAAYFITGKLGLLLAIPPGYATAVWLPSGVALAAMLILGYRAWPGVLLGSLLVNVGVSFDASSTAVILKSLIVAASIGAGATLQAVAGAYLIRRFVGFPSALDDERDVGRFLLLGGPVSSLVNATWSVTTLLAAGAVSADSYVFNWWTWWAGDSIGILIVTPLVLAWAAEPRAGWRRRRMAVTVPLCAAFAMAAFVFVRASAWEQERIRNEFVQRAESIGDALKRSLGQHLEVLESIGDFRAGSPSFDWPDFRAFVAGPLERHPGLRAVSWNPRVSDRDRAEHEAELKRDGFADAGITERTAEGQLVPATRRSEHVFVRYIEPHQQNRPALGYDVASDPTRRDALDRARDSGKPVATARIQLVQDVRREPGFLVFLPVYRDRDTGDTLEERRAALVGYMTGVFRVADLVASSVKNIDSEEVEVALRDTSASDSEQLLYSNQRPRHEDAGAGLSPGSKGIVHEVVIDVAGRRWVLTASPTPRYLEAHRSWQAWTVLAAGLLFTGLLGAFLLVITGRATRVAQLAGRVARLNRVHAVLSGINAAIVHTRDRQELFRKVCRIVIDNGRFRMVWFGLLDKEGQRVMPVASAGDVRGFFDAASTAVTHVKPGGQGLTGRAIREMEPMVSNDIQNDPQRTMKDEFRERGINSLAVLPLIIGNEAVGVVNMYAADVGFFDAEEMRLLRELAGDISFALDSIDKQEKLRRLTRVNEMLSSINGVIVRIRDRMELYQEACRIAVETGAMRFAWLCVVDEDEMRLKPVASAGADDGYLDLIRGRLSLRDDAPEGHGMAAKAVREKRALVVNDAQSDPNVLFKEEHAGRGIRSIAVLPLSVAGKVVGTFGLHSGETGFFDDQETKLINEIAGNIAFALDHIEKEEKVERLNRVYAVLSGINTMIVRVRDRDELFREACRIAIELGRFRLVYVALVDDAAQQIVPVAWAGDHPDLAQRRRPLGPSGPGREGTGSQAIRSKRPVVENNITADSRTLTYPEEVLKRGYRSVGSFPLVVGEKAVGVLGLFAGEPGYFDAQEIKLLQELADDISFALDHLEKEEKVRRLTRVQAMLSGINAAIVRIRDRQELFGEACRIAVEAGKLRFVWIGVVDHEAMQLTPVAWVGEEQDFLAAVRSRLSLSESDSQARALVAQAAIAKETLISNDVANDPRIRFKQEHAKRGIRSLAAFPLMVSNKVFGVFALHAAEVGFFDADEVRLLSELAGDISFALEHIEKGEKLDYLANYDQLTGLANRTLLHERLGQFVHMAEREQHRLALLILDIERFKAVNDAYGRHAGDALLKQIAERMVQSRGDPTRVARLSADHFALVLPRVRSEEQMARRLESRLEEFFAAPYAVAGTELRISAKIGIALFPSDAADPETLLKNAESALKKAKQTGERYVFYAPQMTERVAEKLSLENKLRQALEREEFVLHYQPKVDLERRQVVGVEALIRWQSPELGLVPPMKFIPLLEETGLILPVGSWALKQASLDHRSWVERKLKPLRVAVNVSPIQLRQRNFVGVVEQAIIDGIAPTGIDLEITESLIMEDIEGNIEKLKSIRGLGVNVVIDDFGTGYSSLGYLARLPVQSLKIDRSFIITMLDNPDTMTLVQTIISLAHSLRLTVIAEGVDSEEQAKVLRLLRCDEMQGYLFSKPLPVDALVELLRKVPEERRG